MMAPPLLLATPSLQRPSPVVQFEVQLLVLTPPRFVRSRTYMSPFFPNWTTSFEGVAPGASTTMGFEAPTSVSAPSRAGQSDGAKKSVLLPEKAAPSWKRKTASLPPQAPPLSALPLPLATKTSVPSDETPPVAHMPP